MKLISTDLTRAAFIGADLTNAVFVPKTLPDIIGIAFAKNLDKLKLPTNVGDYGVIFLEPKKFVELREGFSKEGYRQQERKVICALRRIDANSIEKFFFDYTCEYGSNLTRPWILIISIYLFCFLIYYLFMLRKSNSGLKLIENKSIESVSVYKQDVKEISENKISTVIHLKNDYLKSYPENPYNKIPMFIRTFWWSCFFSAVSTFNIGFRDINFGRWLKLLTRKEFDLQPFGWVRVISGFQALMSVYLIALWVLSFAGTPFK